MGIFDKFIEKKVQQKLAPIVHELSLKHWMSSPYSWSAFGTTINSYFSNDVTTSDGLFAVVDTRVRKESSVPFFAYKKKDKEAAKKYLRKSASPQNSESFKSLQIERIKAMDEVVTDSDLARLLARPSFTMGADSFWYAVFYQYATRECFIRKNRGGIKGGKVLELQVLDHRAVTVYPISQGSPIVSHYEYSSNEGVQRVEKEDMIHWKSYDPNDNLRGLDPLRPLKKRLEQDLALTDASVYGAKHNGSSGVLAPKEITTYQPAQVTQIEDTINNVANSTKKAKAIGFLPAPFDYINFSRTADEMQLLEQLGWTFERICHVFGVNPVLFDHKTSFANQEWGQKNWVLNKVIPVVNSLRDALNLGLAPEFKGDEIIDTDLSVLSELQEDYSKIVEYLMKLFNIGAVTHDEIRPLVGFEKSKNPLHQKYYISGNYYPLEDMGADTQEDDLKNYGDY